MSVINAGLYGNQLTSSEIPRDHQNLSGVISPSLFGEAGSQRLAWDVLEQPGATDLIVNIGSNDLRLGTPGAKVIEAYQQLVRQARHTYRRVFGTTIMPGSYLSTQVEQRHLVNSWLREQGKQWFDAVFDFATPLASPENEAVLHPAYNSGDGIHPNDEGYRLVAEAVDISQLTGSRARPA
jgi:lysophospholipase L1-like esterase